MVFGCGCQPEKLLTPLYKETYLGEFLTDTDKKNARMNLGITTDIDISDVKDQLKKEILKELENNSGNNSGNNQGNTQDTPSDDPGKDDPGNTGGNTDNPGGNTSGGNDNPSSGNQEQVGDDYDELDSGESNL